jgi:multiple sugar transport system permease protein
MRTHKLLSKFGLTLLMIPVLLWIYAPIAWLVRSSITTRVELLARPMRWIPQNPTLKHYLDIFVPGSSTSEVSRTIAATLLNSLKVASVVTVVCLILGSMAAYALVRIPFRANRGILLTILGTRMIPEISLVIPLFILAARLRLIDTPYVLHITYLSFSLPFAIWLLAAFFQTISPEIEEAARIDGCSRLGILFRIVIPISIPGVISTALFVFMLAWDEFFYALIFTSSLAAKTVPVALAEFAGRYVTDVNAMMAGGIVAALPPVILALIFQRFIVSGLAAGAVKG